MGPFKLCLALEILNHLFTGGLPAWVFLDLLLDLAAREEGP